MYSIFANEGRWVRPVYTTDDTVAAPLRNGWSQGGQRMLEPGRDLYDQ